MDFEFQQPGGERPTVLCMVASEFRTGRTIRVWADQLATMVEPPFPIGPDCLFVAFYSSAELGCFLALGWSMPARVLDLFIEFRCLTNGLPTIAGNGLLGAMAHFGLGALDAAEKDDMRQLAMRGGSYTADEQAALIEYCESDVVSLAKLLPAMFPNIDLPRALLRGRYMAAAARMEWNGVPIDVPTLTTMRSRWDEIKDKLIPQVDKDFGV